MKSSLHIAVGALASVVLAAGIVTATVVDEDPGRPRPFPTTTSTSTDSPVETSAPTTETTQPPPPATTTSLARPTLSPQEASRLLCREINEAIRIVSAGRTVSGGLRLTRAVNAYGEAADPSVVSPARRMLASGLRGDFEASAAATQEAALACTRLGYPVEGGVQCVQAPCP
jgi:hypothetical protein